MFQFNPAIFGATQAKLTIVWVTSSSICLISGPEIQAAQVQLPYLGQPMALFLGNWSLTHPICCWSSSNSPIWGHPSTVHPQFGAAQVHFGQSAPLHSTIYATQVQFALFLGNSSSS